GVSLPPRTLGARGGPAGGRDLEDEACWVPANLDPVERADIDVLGIGRARVHADLAADDDAGVGLTDQAQCVSFARVFAQPIADRRTTAAKCQKPPGDSEMVALGHGVADRIV